jgi:lysyl-tRNA synthetase class 2
MKRMLSAGYEKIFQICRCWREGERGSQHISEFTLLEWYRTGCDYRGFMEECEAWVQSLSGATGQGRKVLFRNHGIDMAEPWERVSVEEAFRRYGGMTAAEALERGLFDEIMVRDIEPWLGVKKPTILYDYPAARGANARLKEEDQTVAERFELYMGGLEVANAFTELTDVEEQRGRFQTENGNRSSINKPTYPLPEKFLVEMEGMPASAGIAAGIDRLTMIFVDAGTIDEVVAFTPEEL